MDGLTPRIVSLPLLYYNEGTGRFSSLCQDNGPQNTLDFRQHFRKMIHSASYSSVPNPNVISLLQEWHYNPYLRQKLSLASHNTPTGTVRVLELNTYRLPTTINRSTQLATQCNISVGMKIALNSIVCEYKWGTENVNGKVNTVEFIYATLVLCGDKYIDIPSVNHGTAPVSKMPSMGQHYAWIICPMGQHQRWARCPVNGTGVC
jgi:hypothetical protein